MKLLQFRLTDQYIRGCDNVDADAFSRAPVTAPTASDELAETEITMHVNSVIKQLPATDQRLEQIGKLSTTDETLVLLKETISNGWPNKIQECPLKLQQYWNYRNDITEVQGLLLYRSRIIIPSELRKEILERIHSGHLGMDKCKRRARDSVFWPGLSNQIEQRVRKCESCIKFAPSKQKEAMLSYTVPTRPWQKIASDILKFAGKDYFRCTNFREEKLSRRQKFAKFLHFAWINFREWSDFINFARINFREWLNLKHYI